VTDRDPIGTDRRAAARDRRLGWGPRVCPFCGVTDPVSLVPTKATWLQERGVPRTLFQPHHECGQAHEPDLTVLVCRNCHAMAHEGLLQSGVNLRPEPKPVLRDALRLDALAVLFETLARAFRRWANEKRKRNPRNHRGPK
jgi:hypothetical protein